MTGIYLKKTLDYCKKKKIPVVVNGDFFCLMQGRGDRRSNKSDIRPEHNNAKYLDSVVNTAVEWFKPYAEILAVIGYGNHETAIIKYQETDILRRFVSSLNHKCGTNVQVGGYGGWIVYVLQLHSSNRFTFKHKYFHGSGGGGIVTRGEINLTRAATMLDGFDIFSMGHIHENKDTDIVLDTITHHPKKGYSVSLKPCHLMVTGTYKEEYGKGDKGWHVERGAPPKPVGGRLLDLTIVREQAGGLDVSRKIIRSWRFPF